MDQLLILKCLCSRIQGPICAIYIQQVTMSTLFGQDMSDQSEKHSIIDDFAYGSNVASSAVYVRMGEYTSKGKQCRY